MKDDFNMNREDDFLSWWLYEDVDKVIYDDDKKISVKTLEELYNFIISN